jgi:hypothetical protein
MNHGPVSQLDKAQRPQAPSILSEKSLSGTQNSKSSINQPVAVGVGCSKPKVVIIGLNLQPFISARGNDSQKSA